MKNGSGPTVLFTGGVHGDEYEGQIAVSRLARRHCDPAPIKGRVIMLPAVNVPAVLNDTRLSPVDHRDMNRCFPGNPRGTFSEMLAHFIDTVLLPLVDVSVDLHTAGHSMESALSTNMHYVDGRRAARAHHGGRRGVRRALQRRVLGRRRGRDADVLGRAARHPLARHGARRLGARAMSKACASASAASTTSSSISGVMEGEAGDARSATDRRRRAT